MLARGRKVDPSVGGTGQVAQKRFGELIMQVVLVPGQDGAPSWPLCKCGEVAAMSAGTLWTWQRVWPTATSEGLCGLGFAERRSLHRRHEHPGSRRRIRAPPATAPVERRPGSSTSVLLVAPSRPTWRTSLSPGDRGPITAIRVDGLGFDMLSRRIRDDQQVELRKSDARAMAFISCAIAAAKRRWRKSADCRLRSPPLSPATSCGSTDWRSGVHGDDGWGLDQVERPSSNRVAECVST